MDNPTVFVTSSLLRLKKGFESGANRDYKSRIANLKALNAVIERFAPKIQEALMADLRRDKFLTTLTEIEALKDVVAHYCKDLKNLMKDDSREVPALYAPSKAYVKYEPFGVALIIGSWNFPFTTTINPLINAIAAGNCCLIKPSEMSPCSSAVMKEMIESLDPLVFACAEGGPEMAIALLKERWDVIAFTGSPEKGKLIAAAAANHLTPVILELGGKNPTIVDSDANLDNATKRIVQGRYMNAGQLCISPDMALVHSSRLDEFLQLFKTTITEFFGPDPKQSPDYSRIVNDMHTRRIAKLLEGHNGKVIVGGQVDLKEKYIAPTVVLNPDRNSPLGSQEVFGPILVVYSYNTLDECIELINSREKPLALYYFGSNKANFEKLKNRTSSGNITWNDCVFHATFFDLPFGGVGNSGLSKMHGKEGFLAFSHAKSILERNTNNSYPANARYPPYTESKQKLFFRLKNLLGFNTSSATKAIKLGATIAVAGVLAYKGYLDPLNQAISSYLSAKFN